MKLLEIASGGVGQPDVAEAGACTEQQGMRPLA
jgi:hypothetical protein